MTSAPIPTVARLLARLQVTAGRVAVSVLVGAAVTLAALAANVGGSSGDVPTIVVEVLLLIVVPVVSLLFGAAALGDPHEDGSLVYVWLRPIPRWQLAIGAVASSVAVALPINLTVTALVTLVGGRPSLLVPAVVAAALASVAYVAIFTALGLRTTRSLLWGLGYVLLIEGFLVRLSEQISAISVRRYAVSIFTQLADAGSGIHEVSLATGVTVLLVLTAVGLAATTRWLTTRDVE